MMTTEELAAIPPERKCYCCWHLHGQCPHCPKDLTGAVKVRDRGNDKPSTVCVCNDRAA